MSKLDTGAKAFGRVLGAIAIGIGLALLFAFIAGLGGFVGATVALLYNEILGASIDPMFAAFLGSMLALMAGSTEGSDW